MECSELLLEVVEDWLIGWVGVVNGGRVAKVVQVSSCYESITAVVAGAAGKEDGSAGGGWVDSVN